jgi:hypothetical protein
MAGGLDGGAAAPAGAAGATADTAIAGRRLAIVMSTDPARGDGVRAGRLAHAARAAGVAVDVFLMDAAAVWAESAEVAALVDEGCEVVVCATSFDALSRKSPFASADLVLQNAASAASNRTGRPAPGVLVGSQDDHARMISRAERVVAFT